MAGKRMVKCNLRYSVLQIGTAQIFFATLFTDNDELGRLFLKRIKISKKVSFLTLFNSCFINKESPAMNSRALTNRHRLLQANVYYHIAGAKFQKKVFFYADIKYDFAD